MAFKSFPPYGVVLDYSTVADIYRAEQSSPQLAKLPPHFYRDLRELLRQKRQEILEKSEDLDAEAVVAEYRRLLFFQRGIVQKRLEKIFFHAARGTTPENMTEEEERLFEALQAWREAFTHEAYTGERKEVGSPLKELEELEGSERAEGSEGVPSPPEKEVGGEELEEVKAEEAEGVQAEGSSAEEKPEKTLKEGYIQVLITEYVEAYRGLDGKVYGPYKRGEVVELPKEEGEWLVKAGMAKKA